MFFSLFRRQKSKRKQRAPAIVAGLTIALFIFSIVGIGFLFKFLSQPADAAWFNDNWLYRNAIPISSHTAAEVHVYISVTIDTSATGQFKPNCGDLRFTDYAGKQLPYFISSGCGSASTVIHVFFQTFPAGAQTIYYYYGNASAPNGFVATDFPTQASNYVVGSVAAQEKGGGPVGYWKFDEGNGATTKDSSPHQNNGTLVNGTSWQSDDQCVTGKCLKFNGSTDYVNAGNPTGLRLNTDMTAEVWVKFNYLDYTGNTGSLLGFGGKGTCDSLAASNGWWFAYDNRNNAKNFNYTCFGNSAGGFSGGGNNFATVSYTFNQGVWYHIAFTVTSTQAKLYINGKQEGATRTMTNLQLTDSTSNVNMGRMGSGYYHKGSLDDFKIFNYAKTAAQIKADYASRGQLKGSTASLGSSSKSSDALSNGLVGHWKMDENTGTTVTDSSGNNGTLTFNGTTPPTWAASGKYGTSITQDGANTLATTPNSSALNITTDKLTISSWVYLTSYPTNTYGVIAQKSGYVAGYRMMINGNAPAGRVYFSLDGQNANKSFSTTATIPLNTWTHVVGTYDGAFMKVYINGTFASSLASTGNLLDSSAYQLTIGKTEYIPIAGSQDEVRIYNRALSPKEVQDLYNWAPSPLINYQFEEKSGSSVNDESGNSNTGTINGVASWKMGKYGSGFSMNGSSTYISKSSASAFDFDSKNFTVEAWVKPNAAIGDVEAGIVCLSSGSSGTTQWCLVTDNDDYVFYTDADGSWAYTDAAYTSDDVTTEWAHIVGVYTSGSSLKIYKNGVLMFTDSSVTSNLYNPASPTIWVGRGPDHGYFNGTIDDVRIYNYARTQKQILEDMNAGHPAGGSPVGSQIGYWKLDEGNGILANNSGNTQSIRGTLTSMASPATPASGWTNNGKFGHGLTFDGNNDYVTMGDPGDGSLDFGTGDFSISFWLKANAQLSNTVLLGKGNENCLTSGYRFLANPGGSVPTQIKFAISDGTGSPGCGNTQYTPSTSAALDDNWHYIATVINRTTSQAYFYLDGKNLGSTTLTITGSVSGSSILALGSSAGSSGFFLGLMDEVKIYSSALTDDEIKLDYDRGSAMVLGASSNTSGLTGGSIASSSAGAAYCVPGETATCTAPVGEWNFEEGTGGTINDSTGNGNTFTWSGTGNRWTQGKTGKAGNFDGSSNFADNSSLDNANFPQTSGTISMWVKGNLTSQSYKSIFDDFSGARRHIFIRTNPASGNLQIRWQQASGYIAGAEVPVIDNVWNFICITYDTTIDSAKIYVNGTQQYSGTMSDNTWVPDGQDVRLSDANYFNGQIDQVRIFNYARSQSQVAWDYNQGKPIVHWKMDECQGSSLNDSSGFGNTGTITIGASGTQTATGTCGTSGAWFGGVTGKLNYSLNLDGTDDYVSKASPANLPSGANPFSTSLWIKSSSGTSNLYILKWGLGGTSNAMNAIIYYGGTGGISHAFYANDLSSGASTVTSGAWNHFTVTFDGTTRRIYINGKQTATDTPAGVNVTANQTLYMGTYTGSGNYFPGQLDDVRIFNYGLTAAQVKNVYNDGAVKFGPTTGAP